MMIGINWSGIRELKLLKKLIELNKVDFIEIMIDNFTHCSPDSILDVTGDIPTAFHIMNSRYIHRSHSELKYLAQIINKLAHELKPLYVSDHLGLFFIDGMPTPTMLEIDYKNQREIVFDNLSAWQDMLNCRVFIENYPSIIDSNSTHQPEFYHDMIHHTGCGLLFDISNAYIAEKNTSTPVSGWSNLVANTSHFHIGGYESTSFEPSFLVDSHDSRISNDCLKNLKKIHTLGSLSVERDDNFIFEDWVSDVVVH